MKIVRTARLWFKEGTSDKRYEVDLVDTEAADASARFLVNFRYGRRGQTLRDGTKTPAPVARAAAERLFDSVIVAKINDGYRRMDGGEDTSGTAPAPAAKSPEGRERELLARLEACLREPWPPKERDRLFWRIGEVRIKAAATLLLPLADRLGYAEASYSLVWALARCGGAYAADSLLRIAKATDEPLIRGLARFALVSPLMGDRRLPAEPHEKLPENITRAIVNNDIDAFCGAFAEFAQHEPARVGPVMAELYGVAQENTALHSLLVAFVGRIPARPPYVPGLRRLFKYAEMTGERPCSKPPPGAETATPMYREGWPARRRALGPRASCTSTSISRSPTFRGLRTPKPRCRRRRCIISSAASGGRCASAASWATRVFSNSPPPICWPSRRPTSPSRAASAITAGKTAAASPTPSNTGRSPTPGPPGSSCIATAPPSACSPPT
jgi:hypothetical protein